MRQSDCPPELKILVADMLSAYDLYKQGHESLFSARTQDDLHKASSQTVEKYLENRLIWEELNHYKNTKSILGKHPLFDRLRRFDHLRSMKIFDLVHRKIRLDNNLVRIKAKIRRNPGDPLTLKRRESAEEMQAELAEVNRLLNLS